MIKPELTHLQNVFERKCRGAHSKTLDSLAPRLLSETNTGVQSCLPTAVGTWNSASRVCFLGRRDHPGRLHLRLYNPGCPHWVG